MKQGSLLHIYFENMRDLCEIDAHLTTWCLALVLWNNVIHDKVALLMSSPEWYKTINSTFQYAYADESTVYLANNRIMVDKKSQEITFAETLFLDYPMETQKLSVFMRIFKSSMKDLEEYFAQGKKNQSYVLGVLLPLYEIIAEQYALPKRAKMDILQVAISPTEKVDFENYVFNTNYIIQTINAFLKAHGYSSILSFKCMEGVCTEPVTEVVRFSTTSKPFPKTVQKDIQEMLKQSPALSEVISSAPIKEVYTFEEISGDSGVLMTFSDVPNALYRSTKNLTQDYLLYYGAFYHQYEVLKERALKYAPEHEEIVTNWENYSIAILTMRALLQHPNVKEKNDMLADLFVYFEQQEEMTNLLANIKIAWGGNPKDVWNKKQWRQAFENNNTEKLKQFLIKGYLPKVEQTLSWIKEVIDEGEAKAFDQHCSEAPGTAVPFGNAEQEYPCT